MDRGRVWVGRSFMQLVLLTTGVDESTHLDSSKAKTCPYNDFV